MNKIIGIDKAVSMVKDGDKLMIGGFGHVGSPRHLLSALAKTDVKNLHTVSDDLGLTFRGFDQTTSTLLDKGMISSAQCCFIGQNPRASKRFLEGKIDIEFIPMGTLAERIRAGGSGIGGFYTKTGVGTLVEEGKETKFIDGEKYILEKPIRADIAFVKAYKADKMGNAVFKYTAQNFNVVMAMAADIVILEVEELVEIGELKPDSVQLPGVFVDYIVEAKEVIL